MLRHRGSSRCRWAGVWLVGLAVATGSDLVMVASYLEMLVGRPSPGEAYAAGSDDVAWA
jgi:hypothetical protein